jgi:hypothetical protein
MGGAARIVAAFVACALVACKAGSNRPDDAAVLFDVQFSAPENRPGSPPKVYELGSTQVFPSAIPSLVFMGKPIVVEKLCGLEQQPVSLSSDTGDMGHAGLEFVLSQRYARYHVELDLCVARLGPPPRPASEPQLAIFLDFPQAYAVGFFGDGTIGLVDPEKPTTDGAPVATIGKWQADRPIHVAIDADLEHQIWTIALDGKPAWEGKFGAYLGRAVRVVLRGNEANTVAFDNFTVWGERDLAAGLAQPPSEPKLGDE